MVARNAQEMAHESSYCVGGRMRAKHDCCAPKRGPAEQQTKRCRHKHNMRAHVARGSNKEFGRAQCAPSSSPRPSTARRPRPVWQSIPRSHATDHECHRERDSRDVERPSILIKLSALRIDVYMFTTLPICKGDSPPGRVGQCGRQRNGNLRRLRHARDRWSEGDLA